MIRTEALLTIQAVYACFLREWQEFGRSISEWSYRVILAFTTVLPILLAELAFGGSGFNESGGGSDFVSYVAIGWLTLGMAETALLSGQGYLRWANDSGVLAHVWSTPIARWIPLFGTTLFDLLRATIEALLVLAIIAGVFGRVPSGFSAAALPALVLMLLAFWGFGVALAGLGLVSRQWTIPYLLNALLFVFAGTTFPIQILPWSIRWISLAIPHTYIVDALRATLLGSPTIIPLWAEMLIITFWAVCGLWGGLVIYWKMDRIAAKRGLIGLY